MQKGCRNAAVGGDMKGRVTRCGGGKEETREWRMKTSESQGVSAVLQQRASINYRCDDNV